MPISAPSPSSPPSAKRVEALTSTVLELTSRMKRRHCIVAGDDRFGMERAVAVDMRYRFIHVGNNPYRQDQFQVFG